MSERIQDLLERRVPQWTAVYLGAGWGLVQFIAFMEQRYLISPRWTDLCLLSLALLLPSVVLYTYNHGRPGADKLQTSEKFGIPANLVLAGLIVWFAFRGADLGAMTTEVTVTGADGETIARELPKAAYRRRIAVFTPEVTRGADTAWTTEALTLGMVLDLSQDAWLDVRYGPYFDERLREAGFEPGQAVPLALKREIAQEMNLTHFSSATIEDVADGGYRATFRFYEVGRGRLIGEHTYTARELLPIVDSATLALRTDLELPQAHLDEVEDLPVAERMTSRPEALRAYAQGARALHDNNWAGAARHFSDALDRDSTFAMAAVDLFQARLYTSDHDGAMAALGVATSHLYRLPERMQLFIRAARHQMEQQTERAVGTFEMARQLYPDDIRPRVALAQIYPQLNRREDAIASLEEVLRIDPAQSEYLLVIGGLYEELGQDDSAFAAYRRYVDAAPDRPDGLRAIGDLHARRGEHDRAREQYERAILLDGQDVDVLVAMASLARDAGDFDEARAQLDAAEAAARTPQARNKVFEARSTLLSWLGQPSAAYTEAQRALEQAAQYTPPMIAAIYQLGALKPLAEAGRVDEAQRALAAIAPRITGIFSEVSVVGAFAIEAGRPEPDAARLEAIATRLEALIDALDWQFLRPRLLDARALAAERRGDYETSLRLHREQLALEPAALGVLIDIARSHRLRGDLVEAARALEEPLRRRPADPRARYEMAMIHEAAGRSEQAVDELRHALEAWSDAEPEYAPAARAREALARLLSARPAAG